MYKHNHFKFLGVFDDASPEASIPATIARSLRIEDDAEYGDASSPIQRRNVAGKSHTHKSNLRGQQTANTKFSAALAPAKTAGVKPCIDEHIVPAGFSSNYLSVIIASAAVSASPGDVIGDSGTPTKTGVVAFVSEKIIWYLPDTGTFSDSDAIWIEGADSGQTVASVFEQGAVEYSLNSRPTERKQLFLFRDGNVEEVRTAVPTYSLEASQTMERIMQTIEYQGRKGTLAGEASDPSVTYPDGQDLQFADADIKIERLTSADTIVPAVHKLGFNAGTQVEVTPDARQAGGVEGGAYAGRTDVQITMDIKEQDKSSWDPYADKAGQQMRISCNVSDLMILVGLGQIHDVQPTTANNFLMHQLTFDLNDDSGDDTEFRMILTAEEVVEAANA